MSLAEKYRKLIGPLVGTLAMAVVLWYRAALADTRIGSDEWVLLVIQVVMVVSVWGAANVPGWTKGKTVQAALLAVLALLAATITNPEGVGLELTGDEITQLIITGLSALGVAAAPQAVGVLRGSKPPTPAPPRSY